MGKDLKIIPRQKGSKVSNVIKIEGMDFRKAYKLLNFVPRDMSLRHFVITQQGIDLDVYVTLEGRFSKLDLSYTDVMPPYGDWDDTSKLQDIELHLTDCFIYVFYLKGEDTLYLRSEWYIDKNAKFHLVDIGENGPNRGRDVRKPGKSTKDSILLPFKCSEGGKEITAFICVSPGDMQLPWKALVGKDGMTTKENLKQRCPLPSFFGDDAVEPEGSKQWFVIEDVANTSDLIYEMHRLNKFFTHFLGKYFEYEHEQSEEGQLREAALHLCGIDIENLRLDTLLKFEEFLGESAKKSASSPYEVVLLDGIANRVAEDSRGWPMPTKRSRAEQLRKGKLDGIHYQTVLAMATQCANSTCVNMYCQALTKAIKSDHFKKYIKRLVESEDKATRHYGYKLFLKVRENLDSWPEGWKFLNEDYADNQKLIEEIESSDLDEYYRVLSVKTYLPATVIKEENGKPKVNRENMKKALERLKKNASEEVGELIGWFEKSLSAAKESEDILNSRRLQQLLSRTGDTLASPEAVAGHERTVAAFDTMFFVIHSYFVADNVLKLYKGQTDAKTIYATAGSIVSLADDTLALREFISKTERFSHLQGRWFLRSLPKVVRIVKIFGFIFSCVDYIIAWNAIYDSTKEGKAAKVVGHSFVALSAAFGAAAGLAQIMGIGTISLGVVAVSPAVLLIIAIGAFVIGSLILLFSDDTLTPQEQWLFDCVWGKGYKGSKSIEKIRSDLLAFYQLIYGFKVDGDLSGREIEVEIEPKLLSLNSPVNVQFGYWKYSVPQGGGALIQSKEILTFEWLESITLKKGVAAKSTYGSFGLTSVETETMDEDKNMVEKIELEAQLRSSIKIDTDIHSFVVLVSLDTFGFGDEKAYVKNVWVYPGANRNDNWQTVRKQLTGQLPSDPEVMVLQYLEELMLAKPRGDLRTKRLYEWVEEVKE